MLDLNKRNNNNTIILNETQKINNDFFREMMVVTHYFIVKSNIVIVSNDENLFCLYFRQQKLGSKLKADQNKKTFHCLSFPPCITNPFWIYVNLLQDLVALRLKETKVKINLMLKKLEYISFAQKRVLLFSPQNKESMCFLHSSQHSAIPVYTTGESRVPQLVVQDSISPIM